MSTWLALSIHSEGKQVWYFCVGFHCQCMWAQPSFHSSVPIMGVYICLNQWSQSRAALASQRTWKKFMDNFGCYKWKKRYLQPLVSQNERIYTLSYIVHQHLEQRIIWLNSYHAEYTWCRQSLYQTISLSNHNIELPLLSCSQCELLPEPLRHMLL